MIINETMARVFWGAADPVGQRMAWGNQIDHGPWMRIVGVVGDVKQGPLNTKTEGHIYTPWVQGSDAMIADNVVGAMRSLHFTLGSELDPVAMVDTVRRRIYRPVHYMGGIKKQLDLVDWPIYMEAENALPPVPSVFGEGWREEWERRVTGYGPWLFDWLEHQVYDDWWKHGSLIEDYATIDQLINNPA